MTCLFLVKGVRTVGDHAHGPPQVIDPVGPNLVAFAGGLLNVESGVLIA